MATLADILDCLLYTSELGSEEEKAAILLKWLANNNKPVIVAMSTLGIRFDYPHM